MTLTGYLAFALQHKCNLLNINSLGMKCPGQCLHTFEYFCAILCEIVRTILSLPSVRLTPEHPLEEIQREEGNSFGIGC